MKKLALLMLTLFTSVAVYGCQQTTTTEFDSTKNITVYTRDTTSGTREAFFSGISFHEASADNTPLVSTYVEVDGNASMITSIQNDNFGIGYISLSTLSDSGLMGVDFNGVQATTANVLNGTYGLQRPFNYMIRADWTGMETEHQIVEAFVAYMSTVDGKATIQNKHGIIESTASDPLWDDIKDNYSVCSLDNSDVTIYFGGSTSVESMAKALSAEFSTKCGNFIPEHNHTGSGDSYLRTQGSEKDGANKLHIGFLSRNVKDSEPAVENTTGKICLDAVVIVVNANNPLLTSITADEIKKIYSGDVTVWSEIQA